MGEMWNLDEGFRVGDWVVLPRHGTLSRADQLIHSEPKVMDVLMCLARHSRDVVTREQFAEEVWAPSIVSDEVLTRAISVLRTTLGDDPKEPQYIQTIPRRGYRLVTEVAPIADKRTSRASRQADSDVSAVESPTRQIPGFFGRPALAVLPFEDLTEGGGQEYFADGIVEDLIFRLGAYRWFLIIARHSSYVFKHRRASMQEIARELRVRYVVAGSLRRSQNKLRIAAQLIDAEVDRQIWSERFDADLQGLFTVQDELSEKIARSIEPTLRGSELKRHLRRDAVSLDAWERVQRAGWHLEKYTDGDRETARTLARSAIELDPQSSAAHAILALIRLFDALAPTEPHENRRGALSDALVSARLAVERDPDDPRALQTLANVQMWRGSLEEALVPARRAVEISPSFALGHWQLGQVLAATGNAKEALECLARAFELSPYDPLIGNFHYAAAGAHFAASDFAAAAREASTALELRPELFGARLLLVASLALAGDLGAAQRQLQPITALDRWLEITRDLINSYFGSAVFFGQLKSGLKKAGAEI